MAQIVDGNGLTDFQDGNRITQFQDLDGNLLGTGLPPNPILSGGVFPNLRFHAMWLLFVMIPF